MGEEELETLYRRHQSALLRQANRLTRSRADAGDLVQDTFERACRALHTYQPGSSGYRWLSTIMTRLFIDGWRRRKRRQLETPIDEIDLPSKPPAADPECHLVTTADLEAAVATLPAQSRILVERQLAGVPYTALASEMGVQMATVGTRLFRAREKLRAALITVSKTRRREIGTLMAA
jgi:RNA polymerase sigma-70 factor (ECF subfamily)